MYCTQCGNELKEGAAFCTQCGAKLGGKITEAASEPTEEQLFSHPDPVTAPIVNANPNTQKSNSATDFEKCFYIAGIVSGSVSTICGFALVSDYDTGSFESYESYGGDAYTGIQQAAAKTANNVQDLAAITKFGFATLLIVWGFAVICYFGAKLAARTKKH